MAIAALMGVGTAVKGEEVPSLDLNFDGTTSSYTRATTSPTAAKANGDQLATSIVTQGKGGTVQSKYMGQHGKLINGYVENKSPNRDPDALTLAGVSVSKTTGQPAPDGSNTAVLFTATTAGNFYGVDTTSVSFTAGEHYTLSVYMKVVTGTVTVGPLISLAAFGGTYERAEYTISAGGGAPTLAGGVYRSGSGDYGIQDVGDGWYRLWVSGTATTTTNHAGNQVFRVDGAGVGEEVLVWGLQFEEGVRAPSEYIDATADQVARVEYDASGNPLGLLVEEQRTNLLTRTLNLSHSDWSKFGSTVTSGQADPAGGTDGFLADDTNTSGYGIVRQSVTSGVSAGDYTASIFVKKTASAATEFILRLRPVGDTQRDAIVDTQNGVVSGSTATITAVGSDWYRVSVTATVVTATELQLDIVPAHADTYGSGADPTSEGSHIVYGPQIEKGEAATSYIPTTTTSLIRPVDDITVSTSGFGFDVANSSTAIKASLTSEPSSSFPRLFEYRGSAAAYRIFGRVSAGKVQVGFADSATGTSLTSNLATGVTYPLEATVGVAHTGTDISYALDGDGAGSATSSGMSTALTTLELGGQVANTTNAMNGHIRRLRYWPRAINDAQLSKFTNQ